MAISKYTLYKYVKAHGTWRYCKAAYHDNGKIKPDIVFVSAKEGLVQKHTEGRYYMNHSGSWIDAGTDAVEAGSCTEGDLITFDFRVDCNFMPFLARTLL